MRLAVIEVLLHSSRQLHLQIWSSSCTLQMGSRATPCRNHKRWGLEWSRKHGFLSNQYPLCPAQSAFYHPLCFIEISGPLHFPFLQFCAAFSGLPSASAEVVFLMVGITAVYCDLQGLVHFCPKNVSEISLPMAQWQHQSQLRGLVFGLLVCAFCLIGRAAAV